MAWFLKKNAKVPKDKAKDIPADFKQFYKEEGDDFVLDESQQTVIDLIDGLNTANGRLRGEVDALKKSVDLSELSEFGSDVPSIKAAFTAKLAELTEKADSGKMKNVDFEKAKADMIAERDRAIADAKAETDKLRGTMNSYVRKNAIQEALMKHNGNSELLMDKLLNLTDVVQDGDTFRTVVKGSDGKHRVSPTNGELLGVDDLVREMKANDVYAPAFKSEAASGGPTSTTSSGGGGLVRTAAKDMTPAQKIAAGLNAMKK